MTRSVRARRCGNRRLHLIDVENLVGSPRPSLAEVEDCAARYRLATAPGPSDQYVVACNHGAAAAVSFGWPGARVRMRSGPDGADLALIEVIERERVAERFSDVIVGSGDGIFAPAVARLVADGVAVTVASLEGSLSRRLELAAPTVVLVTNDRPDRSPALTLRVA